MQQFTHPVTCPYCGQVVEVVVDPSVHFQEYVEDCQQRDAARRLATLLHTR